jgi:hypothetical protein
MRLDITKIDDRISKLQTIREMASDPEMARMILEFMAPDEDTPESPGTIPSRGHEKTSVPLQAAPRLNGDNKSRSEDEASRLVDEIITGKGDSKIGAGAGLWSKTRV